MATRETWENPLLGDVDVGPPQRCLPSSLCTFFLEFLSQTLTDNKQKTLQEGEEGRGCLWKRIRDRDMPTSMEAIGAKNINQWKVPFELVAWKLLTFKPSLDYFLAYEKPSIKILLMKKSLNLIDVYKKIKWKNLLVEKFIPRL